MMQRCDGMTMVTSSAFVQAVVFVALTHAASCNTKPCCMSIFIHDLGSSAAQLGTRMAAPSRLAAAAQVYLGCAPVQLGQHLAAKLRNGHVHLPQKLLKLL